MDLHQLLNWPLKLAYFVVRGIVRASSGNPHWPLEAPAEGEQHDA